MVPLYLLDMGCSRKMMGMDKCSWATHRCLIIGGYIDMQSAPHSLYEDKLVGVHSIEVCWRASTKAFWNIEVRATDLGG